jgi:hypothetical protein
MIFSPLTSARTRQWIGVGVTVVLGFGIAGCGGSSSDGNPASASDAVPGNASPTSETPVTAGDLSTTTAAATGQSGAQWPADTCTVIDQSVLEGIVGLTVTSAGHQPTLESVCNYMGAIPPDTADVIFTALTYYDDRSEWDIHVANSGVNPNDKVPGLGADAFKSSDGIWVLLDDGRMFIADVAYGVADESNKELALANAIAATA